MNVEQNYIRLDESKITNESKPSCERIYYKVANLITISMMITLIVLYVKITSDNSDLKSKNSNLENRVSLIEVGFSVINSNVQNQLSIINKIGSDSNGLLSKVESISDNVLLTGKNLTEILNFALASFNLFLKKFTV